MLTEWFCIISILFFSWVSGSFSATGGEEHGLDMSEYYVFYGVFGVAERSVWSGRVSENHVFYIIFGVAERSIWIEPVGKPCVLQCLRGSKRLAWIERVRKPCILGSFLPRPAPGCQA